MVLDPRGGLAVPVTSPADLAHHLANPLIDQATVFLATLLPAEDVTAVEHSAARGDAEELARRVSSYVRGAPRSPAGRPTRRTSAGVPGHRARARVWADVARAGGTRRPTRCGGGAGTDLMFCREQPGLRPADLFGPARPVLRGVRQMARTRPLHDPHARFDVPSGCRWM